MSKMALRHVSLPLPPSTPLLRGTFSPPQQHLIAFISLRGKVGITCVDCERHPPPPSAPGRRFHAQLWEFIITEGSWISLGDAQLYRCVLLPLCNRKKTRGEGLCKHLLSSSCAVQLASKRAHSSHPPADSESAREGKAKGRRGG